MYAARVIPRDVYARRSRRSLPPGNNVARCQRECQRGSALAYCLKLLIGLRSDAAFSCYAVLLSLSLSPSLCVSLPNPSSTFPPVSASASLLGIDFLDAYCRRRQTVIPDPRNEKGAPGCCVRFQWNFSDALHDEC